jgi:alpha-D-xyloside xylohydrolase
LPYIYGTSWKIASENATLMRALFMDWPEDRNVWNIDDEYMFGDAMLVAPVVTPDDVRNVYLPDGQWFDFWSGEALAGGQSIVRETPIDECPVYVKAGTVLPLGPSVQYAQEKAWDDLIIRIYPGADGEYGHVSCRPVRPSSGPDQGRKGNQEVRKRRAEIELHGVFAISRDGCVSVPDRRL